MSVGQVKAIFVFEVNGYERDIEVILDPDLIAHVAKSLNAKVEETSQLYKNWVIDCW